MPPKCIWVYLVSSPYNCQTLSQRCLRGQNILQLFQDTSVTFIRRLEHPHCIPKGGDIGASAAGKPTPPLLMSFRSLEYCVVVANKNPWTFNLSGASGADVPGHAPKYAQVYHRTLTYSRPPQSRPNELAVWLAAFLAGCWRKVAPNRANNKSCHK